MDPSSPLVCVEGGLLHSDVNGLQDFFLAKSLRSRVVKLMFGSMGNLVQVKDLRNLRLVNFVMQKFHLIGCFCLVCLKFKCQ